MRNSYSATESSSPSEDDDAPPPSVPLVVDVLDRDRDDVGIESCHSMMGYDELYEILSWMSAKSGNKYSSCLCTWLHSIHSEPHFIRKQCIHSHGQDNSFFLQPMLRKYGPVSKEFEFHILPWETGSAFGIPPESLDYLPKCRSILSSSNGPLLLGNPSRIGSCEFMVCNPATKEWAPLPTPEGVKVKFNEDYSPLFECYPWAHGVLDEVEFPNDYTIAVPVQPEIAWVNRQGVLVLEHKQQLLIYSNGKWEEELCDVSIEGPVVRYDMPVAIF